MSTFIFISYQFDKIINSLKKRNKFFFIGFSLSLLLNLINWFFLYFKFPLVKDIPAIPLHYNIYFGIDLIGPPIRIFILPLFGFLVVLVNLILSYIIYIKERLLSYFLVGGSILIEIFLLIASIFVISINL